MPLGKEVGLDPGGNVLDEESAPPNGKGTAAPPPLFDPCPLWPRSPISATAELLYILFANCYWRFSYCIFLQHFLTAVNGLSRADVLLSHYSVSHAALQRCLQLSITTTKASLKDRQMPTRYTTGTSLTLL